MNDSDIFCLRFVCFWFLLDSEPVRWENKQNVFNIHATNEAKVVHLILIYIVWTFVH